MGSTKIEQPAAPAAPTASDNVAAYTGNLDAMYNASLKYDPMITAQQVSMAQQFAPQFKAISDALNPQASQMNEAVAGVAASGMGSQMPDWMKATYQDQLNANLGNQAGSGIGADYVSRGMLADAQQYQQYYNNLGLSVAGLNPVYSGQSYQQQQPQSVMSGYNYGQVANNNVQGYGSYSSAYASMYGSNQQAQASQNQLYGSMIGGASSMGAAMLMPK